jgi:hypothetical protein
VLNLPPGILEGLKSVWVRRGVRETPHKLLRPIRSQKELAKLVVFLDKIIKEDSPIPAVSLNSFPHHKEWRNGPELESKKIIKGSSP